MSKFTVLLFFTFILISAKVQNIYSSSHLLLSVSDKTKHLAEDSVFGVFYGHHDLTNCLYTFYINGNVICDEQGHLAMGYTKGTFERFGDTLIVTPLPGEQQRDSNYYRFKTRFFLEGDTAIINLEIYYDFRRLQPGENPFYLCRKRNRESLKIEKE